MEHRIAYTRRLHGDSYTNVQITCACGVVMDGWSHADGVADAHAEAEAEAQQAMAYHRQLKAAQDAYRAAEAELVSAFDDGIAALARGGNGAVATRLDTATQRVAAARSALLRLAGQHPRRGAEIVLLRVRGYTDDRLLVVALGLE